VNPYVDRPPGQCAADADCPASPMGPSCSRGLPGGVCLACGLDAHCPAGTECTEYGACARPCSLDLDCPPGMSCSGTGLCRAAACVAGVCPDPLYTCDDASRCARASCTSGEECPSFTHCDAGLCVEDLLSPR
jgi:hypothetical protein